MNENNTKKVNINKGKTDFTAALVATWFNVTPSYVQMIRDGNRFNPDILLAYQELSKAIKQAAQSVKNKYS